MRIVAIILHYYPERTENISRIVKDLKENSRPPDEIIVFNNNPKMTYSGNCTVINSNKNYEGRARYPIALLEPSDYYYFIDDDVTVNKNTIKNFLKYASDNCCYGYWGKIINPKVHSCYRAGNEFYGKNINKSQEVDLLVGKGTFFVSFSVFKNMLKTEEKFLKEGFIFGREEDLILSMSNRCFVIPVEKDSYFKDLNDGGVGYCKNPNHWKMRNEMAKKLYPIRRKADSISISDNLGIKIKKEIKQNGYKLL